MYDFKPLPPSAFPGPFKCPDCGAWWAGFYHLCSKPIAATNTQDFTVRCTCPPDRGDQYSGSCPVHDAHTTYTPGTTSVRS